MRHLDLCLMLLTALFWIGGLIYFFRKPLYEWLDNRIRHEPLTDRLRAAFRSSRK